jgi:protein TonB
LDCDGGSRIGLFRVISARWRIALCLSAAVHLAALEALYLIRTLQADAQIQMSRGTTAMWESPNPPSAFATPAPAPAEPEPITPPEAPPELADTPEPEPVDSEPSAEPEREIVEAPEPPESTPGTEVAEAEPVETEEPIEPPVELADATPTDSPPPPEMPATESVDPLPAPSAVGGTQNPGITRGVQLATRIAPVYPPACVRRGQEGVVVIVVEVLPTGRAGQCTMVQSSGIDLLDEEALRAIQAAHFLPALQNSHPITTQVTIPVRFSLD